MKQLPKRAWQAVRRVIGYVRSSSDDTSSVYGDDPNGNRKDGANASGNIAANTIGGIGH